MVLVESMHLLKLAGLSRYNVTNILHYSIFPPSFVRPIFKKYKQEKITKEEEEKLAKAKIIPAFSSASCSEFHDELVKKFINYTMRDGKKDLARKLIEETFHNIKILQLHRYHNAPHEEKKSIILEPKKIFYLAVENSKPLLELQNIKRGGIVYQVPSPVFEKRARFLAMNWLIKSVSDRGTKEKFSDVLAKELVDASEKKGRVMKKKHDLHKQCEANRAYAHYRWL